MKIDLFASSKELEDIKLRTNEKQILNGLNNDGKTPKSALGMAAVAENPYLIRHKLDGKVKTNLMKINV